MNKKYFSWSLPVALSLLVSCFASSAIASAIVYSGHHGGLIARPTDGPPLATSILAILSAPNGGNLLGPYGMTVDGAGNVFAAITTSLVSEIVKVTPSGSKSVFLAGQ